MKYKLSDLIDIPKLQSLLDSLYLATGIPSGVIDTKGNVVTAAGWRSICTDFHCNNKQSVAQCRESNQYISEHLNEGKRYYSYRCKNGLMDIGAPIVIDGMHLGNIYQGQFFFEKPDLAFFRKQAKRFGYDEKAYLKAVLEIPVVSFEEVKWAVDFLVQFAEMLAELGLRCLQQLEYQKKLRESEDHWKFVVEGIEDGIWDWNLLANEIFCSEKCLEIIGRQDGKAALSFIEWLRCLHCEDRSNMVQAVKKHLNGETPYIFCEYRIKGKDGRYKWVLTKGKVITRSEAGKPLRMIGTLVDIDIKKRLERNALEYDKMKNEFLANISHELKTPISVIFSTVQLSMLYLDKAPVGESTEKLKSYMNIIKQNCLRSQRLVNNLLDITCIESGFYELHFRNCDIVRLLRDIVEPITDYAATHDIRLFFHTNCSSLIISCDPEKIERAVLNLIANALKFTEPEGNIAITVDRLEDIARISIADTGAGIPHDKLNVIFERFRQLDGLFVRRNEGSGIGLAIAKSIVELHNGKISVESEYGEGSNFIIELPIKKIPEELARAGEAFYPESQEERIQRILTEFSDIYLKK